MNNILAVGVDIEDVARFRNLRKGSPFFLKSFTPRELAYCKRFADPFPRLAGKFCAKEAVIKCLSSLKLRVKKLEFKDIELLNEEDGTPCVKLLKKIAHAPKLLISISHTKKLAIAFCVAVS
ncbi:MAG: holo-ACP synthase [Candidatus Micrarchaeota archaeon]